MAKHLHLIISPASSAVTYRYLLGEFIAKEIKGRFAGTMAGILWTFISPITNIAIYLFLFSLILRIQVHTEEVGTDSFVIFFLSGFFPWLFFSEGISRSASVLIQNANLITKVVFPVELLPAGTVISSFIINGIGMIFFLVYAAIEGYLHLSWTVLFLIVPVQFFFIWGLANFISAACVFFRDINELLGIVIMVWFYMTPVIYPLSMVPEEFRNIIIFNPMLLFVELYRSAIVIHQTDWQMFMQVCYVSFLIFGLGSWFFMRAKPAFGDVL